MRRAVALLLFLALLVGALWLLANETSNHATPAPRDAAGDAVPRGEITLRGRPPSPTNERANEAGSSEGESGSEPATGEAPVRLTIHVELEGSPPGTPLDPPASIHVHGLTDPIDSFFSVGVHRDVASTGRVDIDVRSVLGEVGRLGRAPEMAIWVGQPGGHLRLRNLLLMDIEGLRAGRRTLDEVAFTLRPATRVTGTVRGASGPAIGRGSVRAYRMAGDAPLPETVHAVDVGPLGRFEMALEGEGRFLLVAFFANLNDVQREAGYPYLPQGKVVVLAPGQDPAPVEFQLAEGSWIEGTVQHPASGLVAGDGLVRWHLVEESVGLQGRPDELAWIDGEVVWARGDARVGDGHFRVRGLPARACDFAVVRLEDVVLAEPLGATRRGPDEMRVALAPACATLQFAARTEEDTPLPSSFSVVVLPPGANVGDTQPRTVSSGSPIAVSPSSVFRVQVHDARFAATVTEVVSGQAGTTTEVVVPLVPITRSTLVVHLRQPDGTPYRGWAAFSLADPQSPVGAPRPVWSSARYGRDGIYRLEGVPDGAWRLHLRPARSTFGGRPSEYLERTVEVEVPPLREPGAVLPVEVGGRLVVRVADRDGVPRAGRVSIQPRGGDAVPAVFVSDWNFYFEEVQGAPGELPAASTLWLATALEPGTYDVHIVPDGASASIHTIHLESGETEAISVTLD